MYVFCAIGENHMSQGVPDHHQFPGPSKRYFNKSRSSHPSAPLETAFVNKDAQRVLQQQASMDNVCYHAVGPSDPGTPLHNSDELNHIYQCAEASWEGKAAENPCVQVRST